MRLVTFREYENFVANHNIRGELILIEMLRYFAAGAHAVYDCGMYTELVRAQNVH